MGMGGLWENLYDVLFQPGIAMRRIAADRPVAQALVTFFISVLIPTVGMYFAFRSDGMGKLFYIVILLQAIGSFLAWFSGAAILHLIAECFGGRGTALGLFTALGFAHLPRILAIPLVVVAMLLPAGGATVLVAITSLFILFWTMALAVIAIKGAHEMSTAKALLALLTPFLTLTVVVVALVAFCGTAIWTEMFW